MTLERPISVLIIDNSFLTRQGLRYLLESEFRAVCAEAANAGDALAQVVNRPWDLIILDMVLPHGDSIRILGEIRGHYPAARVLMTSGHRDYHHAGRAHRMGSTGYVGKDALRTHILQAVSDVLSGKPHFGDFQMSKNDGSPVPVLTNLSPREHRVLLALGNGKRPTHIAAELNLSIKTISTYKRRVLNKLCLSSNAALECYVREHELLHFPPND